MSIDFKPAQRRLLTAAYDIGSIDGIAGPRTWAGIFAYVGRRPMTPLMPLGEAASLYLPNFGIDQTVGRICNFVGQAAHETGGFRNLREIWGPTPAQIRYEGRKDLGNTRTGDGRRFLGRGIFQITGRANYRQIGQAIGIDLEGSPELAETPSVAVQTACFYWRTRNLNIFADSGEEDRITRLINGGTNGIDDRRALVGRAKGLFL